MTIPLNKCKDGWLYHIDARNASIGIFRTKRKGFVIARYKFGPKPFLFDELHCEADEHYGTAKPLKLLCEAPTFPEDVFELRWLIQKWNELGRQLELEELEQDARSQNMPKDLLEHNRQCINRYWDKKEARCRRK